MTATAVPKILGYNLDWPFEQPQPLDEEIKKLVLAYGNRFVFAQAIRTVRSFKTPARNPVNLLFSLSNDEKFKKQIAKRAERDAKRLKLLPAAPPTPYQGTVADWMAGLMQLGFFPEEVENGRYTGLWLTDEEYEVLLQECEKG